MFDFRYNISLSDLSHLYVKGNYMSNLNNKTDEIQLLNSNWKVAQEHQISKKEITRAVLAAQEKERVKIGKEIRENLNQILTAALLYIELAKTDDESREMCLERSGSFISTVIKELANISLVLTVREIDMKLVDP
jgi:signal transduction histidine kinase